MEQINLKKARIKLGLSHEEVARKAGISRCFYTQIEKGTRKPSLETAVKISNILGVPVNEIFLVNGDATCNTISTGTEGR